MSDEIGTPVKKKNKKRKKKQNKQKTPASDSQTIAVNRPDTVQSDISRTPTPRPGECTYSLPELTADIDDAGQPLRARSVTLPSSTESIEEGSGYAADEARAVPPGSCQRLAPGISPEGRPREPINAGRSEVLQTNFEALRNATALRPVLPIRTQFSTETGRQVPAPELQISAGWSGSESEVMLTPSGSESESGLEHSGQEIDRHMDCVNSTAVPTAPNTNLRIGAQSIDSDARVEQKPLNEIFARRQVLSRSNVEPYDTHPLHGTA